MSATEATQLLRCALDPRLTAARDPEYGRLIATYSSDLDFRAEVDAAAVGLGLAVVDVNRLQLILSAAGPDSPFAFRRVPVRAGTRTFDERVCAGLIHLAIVCLAYPTAQDLVSDRTPRLSVLQLDQRLRAAAATAQAEGQSPDIPSAHPELERAWALYARQRQTRETPDKRAYAHGTLRWVAREFEWLEEHGLARKEAPDDGGRYRLTRRHRVLARSVAVPEAAKALLGAVEEA